MNRQRDDFMMQGQQAVQEAADALTTARDKLKEAQELYGSGKANLALYSKTAQFQAGRCNDILGYVSEMLDQEPA